MPRVQTPIHEKHVGPPRVITSVSEICFIDPWEEEEAKHVTTEVGVVADGDEVTKGLVGTVCGLEVAKFCTGLIKPLPITKTRPKARQIFE